MYDYFYHEMDFRISLCELRSSPMIFAQHFLPLQGREQI